MWNQVVLVGMKKRYFDAIMHSDVKSMRTPSKLQRLKLFFDFCSHKFPNKDCNFTPYIFLPHIAIVI